MKFILLINVKIVKMPFTFISSINSASESFTAIKILMFQHFSSYEQLKFHAQFKMKKLYYLEAWAFIICQKSKCILPTNEGLA